MIQKPIKVVHCGTTFLPLTENWIYEQIVDLDSISIKFYAIARENKDFYPFSNVRCLREDLNSLQLRFSLAWDKYLHRCPQFLVWLLLDRPNLIHAHFGTNGCRILPYARWLDIPLITSFYGFDAHKLPYKRACWRKRYKALFNRGRLFLVEGPAMRRKLIELGCPPHKIAIHRIGIKLENYEFCTRKADNVIRLMTCGRFKEKKGIPYAVEALRRLKTETKTKIRLTIVGDSDSKGTLTDEKRRILNSINKYEVADSVTITGYIPHHEVMAIARDHQIYIAPSIHASDGDAEGGFPVILTEVLATGMPIVAFNHCDIQEIVHDGKTGFLVPERDMDALTKRLAYLVEHPHIWPEMGRQGRALVKDLYDVDKQKRRLIQIYQEVLSSTFLNP